MSKASVHCPGCGQDYEMEVRDSINAELDPEGAADARTGTLFTHECPACGKMNLVSYPMLYHDPTHRLMLWHCPAEADVQRIKPTLDSAPELSDYTLRIVLSPGEFIEKLKIQDAGLDDVIVEMCKFVTCKEIGSEVDLRFVKLDGADMEMTFTYPKNGDMELVAVGFNVYEDCRGIVGRNPHIKEAARGLVRICPDWLLRFFE